MRCSATPQDDSAPVQSVSLVGDGSWAVGSGIDVEMIQSALPAVSSDVSSNRTWNEATACAACGAVTAAEVQATSRNAVNSANPRNPDMCRSLAPTAARALPRRSGR